jgi:hypothetical protein
MGKMASLFFNKTGRIAFYLCLTIYLYGDLAIYGAAVAKSLRFVNGDMYLIFSQQKIYTYQIFSNFFNKGTPADVYSFLR